MKYYAFGMIATLLISISMYPVSAEGDVASVTKEKQAKVSVSMKQKNKLSLLSVKNSGDEPIFRIVIDIIDSKIKFAKAKGWDAIIDEGTVMLHTKDRALLQNGSLIIFLVTNKPIPVVEWSVYDRNNVLLVEDSLYSHKMS